MTAMMTYTSGIPSRLVTAKLVGSPPATTVSGADAATTKNTMSATPSERRPRCAAFAPSEALRAPSPVTDMGTSKLAFVLGGHRVQWNRTDPNDRVKRFRGVNRSGPCLISEPNSTFGPKRPAITMRPMPDPQTLAETESAMNRHIKGLEIDFAAAQAVSSLYRAANAVRAHIT